MKKTNIKVLNIVMVALLVTMTLANILCVGAVTAVSVNCEQKYGSDYGIEEWCEESMMFEYNVNSAIFDFFGSDYDELLNVFGIEKPGV